MRNLYQPDVGKPKASLMLRKSESDVMKFDLGSSPPLEKGGRFAPHGAKREGIKL